MSARERNMSADENMTPETTFAPPDGLERRFWGLAPPPPLLFRPFRRIFRQKYGKSGKIMKNHKIQFSMDFQVF